MEIATKVKAVELCTIKVKGTPQEVESLKAKLIQADGVMLRGVNVSTGKIAEFEKDIEGGIVYGKDKKPKILSQKEVCNASFNLIIDLSESKGLDIIKSIA